MSKKPKKETKNSLRRRRVLLFASTAFGVLILGFSAASFYAFQQLQPVNRFKNVPAVVQVTSSQKSIHTSTQTPNVKNTTAVQQAPKSSQPTGSINVLLIGSDERPGQTIGHSDSMIIVHMDFQLHEYNIVSIPRDTRVYMDGYGYTKLTSVQYIDQSTKGVIPGIKDTIKAITRLTGIPINYYAETNYWGLKDIVDAMGGVNMDVPFKVTLTHAWYPQDQNKIITAGEHDFNGTMLTEIVHERYSVPGTDYGRQKLQVEALIGIGKTLLRPANITKLPTVYKQLSKYLIATNISAKDAFSMAMAIRNLRKDEIHYYQIPAVNRVMYDDILKANNDELILNDKKMKQSVSEHFMN